MAGITPDQTGASRMTAAGLSTSVDITAAAVWSWVYCLVATGAVEAAGVTFTGWAKRLEADEAASSHYALYRRLKQPGDTTFTVSWTGNSTQATAIWVSYTGLDPTTPDELAAAQTHNSGASFPTPSATPGGAGRWSLMMAYARDPTAATDLPDGASWTPDAALTERLDASNAAAVASPWISAEAADSAGPVTQAAHTYTAAAVHAENHGAAVLLYLIPVQPPPQQPGRPRLRLARRRPRLPGLPPAVPAGPLGGEWDAGAGLPRWRCMPAAQRCAAHSGPPRWEAVPAHPGWHAQPAPPRWEAADG